MESAGVGVHGGSPFVSQSTLEGRSVKVSILHMVVSILVDALTFLLFKR